MSAKRYLSEFPELVAQYAPGQEFSPDKLTWSSNRKVRWVCDLNHEWAATVAQRTRAKSGCPFCANIRAWPGFNDLETKFPAIAAEWHPTKNGGLTPRQVPFGSQKKYWWLCSNGHEWDTKVGNRTGRGSGCRICSGNEVQQSYNDLQTERPEIAAEWHPELNGSVTPSEVSAGSPKKRWWLCPRYGHSYEMSVSRRTGTKKGNCPYCSNQKLLAGFNDLATRNPELAAQFDLERNFPITPSELAPTTKKPFWWKCPDGKHESWLGRTRKGADCPVCMNQVLVTGFNDVATVTPEIAAQWHPILNGDQTPQNTVSGGRQKIWWLCDEGHHWQAALYSRKVGGGCPYCAFKSLWPGFNDLATIQPELAAEWHPTKNGDLSPRDLMSSVSKVVWWLCPEGHSYQASPNRRSRIGPKGRSGCNVCANKVIDRKINHLSHTHPELWDELVKEGLAPERLETVFAGTTEKMLWRCSSGHSWEAIVYSRARNGNGCPDCAEYGFKIEQPSVVYFLAHPAFRARKIGITNTHDRYNRITAFENQGWVTIAQWEMAGRWARVVESQALAWIRGELDLPQYLAAEDMGRTGGATETFTADGPSDREVIAKLDAIIQDSVPQD